MNSKQEIAIVWLKRDLRFIDHEPLFYAQQQHLPVLLLYCFEPSLMQYADSDPRHWRFVYQSLQEMQAKLAPLNAQIAVFHAEVLPVFDLLSKHYRIKTIFSHQEIGNKISYDRDRAMQQFCLEQHIEWKEFQTNGIIRQLKSRKQWQEWWKQKMQETPKTIQLNQMHWLQLDPEFYQAHKGPDLSQEITTAHASFQSGGESYAWRYLDSFLKERHVHYTQYISKPAWSRRGCSRLSPYLSYGNISMRMVYQQTMKQYSQSKNKRALLNFISRLHWHCHFIQKFEDECRMEFEPVNKAYAGLIKPRNEAYILAWQRGQTGVPIVDACMRCVVATGYLNFRMRALVVSFFVFNLWQDWRELHFLARQFLDYEPGIHYPQLHMQSGITGVNTIRIYNPIKNSQEHDAEGEFIKTWVPELRELPVNFMHEPYLMTLLDQQMYQVIIGKDYPAPIIYLESSQKHAQQIMWAFKKNDAVKKEGTRILKKHVNMPKNL